VALRIVADENVPGETVDAMRADGHEVTWMVTDGPGTRDDVILAQAQAENRIVMTFDKDFGELVFRQVMPASSGIILLRLGTSGPSQATAIVMAAIRSRSDWTGHFSVIEEERIRMTPLPEGTREPNGS
jgi:predicted nuclease of predicted toxin-antitoxin system